MLNLAIFWGKGEVMVDELPHLHEEVVGGGGHPAVRWWLLVFVQLSAQPPRVGQPHRLQPPPEPVPDCVLHPDM